MLFQELVEQHRAHRFVANGVLMEILLLTAPLNNWRDIARKRHLKASIWLR